MLVSFDGLSADAAAAQPPFASGDGLHVTRVIPVEPSVTSSTHAAILTGARPEVTGIVSNSFHQRGTPAEQSVRGMEREIEVETLVESMRRQGKRVGAIVFPTVDSSSPRRTADFGLPYGKALAEPRVVTLAARDWHDAMWLPPGWSGSRAVTAARPSFSPVMRARFEWSVPTATRQDVDVVAYDTTDDRVRNYDTFAIEVDGRELPLDANRWFALQMRANARTNDRLVGAWAKLQLVDPMLSGVSIYVGAAFRSEAYPDDFRAALDDAAGVWPGPPDEKSALRGAIDEATFDEQLERVSSFCTTATLLAIRRGDFDLLLAYQPIIDAAEHPFHGGAPVALAYAAMNRAVAAMRAAVDPTRDALVVTGDHGIASIDLEVRINRLLSDWSEGDWTGYTSGNVAQLYRFGGADHTEALMAKLRTAKAPDGSPIFERVVARPSPNAGDIVAFAYPRFALSAVGGEAFVTPAYRGQHGGLASHRELQTALAAWGRGIPNATLASIDQTEIAPFLSRLLGVAPPGPQPQH